MEEAEKRQRTSKGRSKEAHRGFKGKANSRSAAVGKETRCFDGCSLPGAGLVEFWYAGKI